MPLYVYKCKNGHAHEEIRKVEERHAVVLCSECGETAALEIQTSAFDSAMGLDPGFPTAYDRWAKTHWKAAKGK